MISNLDQRLIFEQAVELARQLGYTVNESQCTQSYIRSESAMANNVTQYQMPILVNQNANNGAAQRVTEKRLQLQDIFYVSSVLIGWTVATGTSATGQVYTYPNLTAATSSAIATALNSLYNGNLSIQMNNTNFLPGWDINRHYFAGQTQQNTNFNAATATSPAQYTVDELRFAEDGFYPVEPGWVLNGGGNIAATINLPGAISTIPRDGAIVAIFRGILMQNCSTVK